MDPELEAFNKINEVMKDMPEDAKVRVVTWLISKYSIRSNQPISTTAIPKIVSPVSNSDQEEIIEGEAQSIASFTTPAELLAKCMPKTDKEKVLIVSAYLQSKNPTQDLTGYEINHVLKNIGHGVSSINHRIDDLMATKPQLMIQTKKSGKSKQARKKYRVTDEGTKEVQRLLHKQ